MLSDLATKIINFVSNLRLTFKPFLREQRAIFKLKTLRGKFAVAGNAAYPLAALITLEPVFIVLMLALGLASAFWHNSRTRLGADLDVSMIFIILLFLTGTAFGVNPFLAVIPAIPGGAAMRMKLLRGVSMEEKVGILIAPLLVFGVLSGVPLAISIVVLGAALAIREWIDHGLWHPVSALGLALVARALVG